MATKLTSQQSRKVAQAARLNAEIAALKKQFDAIKAELALPDGTYQANGAELIVTTSNRVTLDGATVKGFLTPAQIAAASITSASTAYRFKLVPVAIAA